METGRLSSAASGFRIASRKSAYEVAHDSLRHAILSGAFAPGTRLVQTELATRLGVSTTPVREALRDLASEGLIQFDSYRGAVVHTPTLEEAMELYEMRVALAPLAVRKAVARIDQRELDQAAELVELMDHHVDTGEWVELNNRFHQLLTEPGSSRRLSKVLAQLRDHAAMHVSLLIRQHPARMVSGNKDHKLMVEAFRRGDANGAEEVTRRHFATTVELIEELSRSEADGPK